MAHAHGWQVGIVNYLKLSAYKCPSFLQLLPAYNGSWLEEDLSKQNCLNQGAGPHHSHNLEMSKLKGKVCFSSGILRCPLSSCALAFFHFSFIDNCLGIIFSILLFRNIILKININSSIFLVYSSMNFNVCVDFCNHHHHDQDTQQFYHPNKLSVLSFCSRNPSPPELMATTDLFFITTVLSS